MSVEQRGALDVFSYLRSLARHSDDVFADQEFAQVLQAGQAFEKENASINPSASFIARIDWRYSAVEFFQAPVPEHAGVEENWLMAVSSFFNSLIQQGDDLLSPFIAALSRCAAGFHLALLVVFQPHQADQADLLFEPVGVVHLGIFQLPSSVCRGSRSPGPFAGGDGLFELADDVVFDVEVGLEHGRDVLADLRGRVCRDPACLRGRQDALDQGPRAGARGRIRAAPLSAR